MKKMRLLYFISIGIVVCFSCNSTFLINGKVEALLNNEKWEAKLSRGIPTPANPDNISLIFHVKSNNYLREELFIDNIPLHEGSFQCSDVIDDQINTVGFSYFRLTSDGDVLESSYILDTSTVYNNFINITKVKPKQNFIKGDFHVTFRKDTTFGGGGQGPELIIFQSGSFKANYED